MQDLLLLPAGCMVHEQMHRLLHDMNNCNVFLLVFVAVCCNLIGRTMKS
jgi:hypothetical protein